MSENPKPSHVACFIVSDGERNRTIPVGLAWPEGDGFVIELEAVPLNGMLVLQPSKLNPFGTAPTELH